MLQSLGILGSPQGTYVRELVTAAKVRWPTIKVNVLSFSELQVSLLGSQRSVCSRGYCDTNSRSESASPGVHLPQSAEPRVDLLGLDALLVRSMPLGSLEQVIFRMDALQAVERAGVPILNPPRALEIAIDKWLTLDRLAAENIPVPPTMVVQDREAGLAAFEQLGGDVVVKPLFGGEGRGILRVSDRDMAWRVFSTLPQLGSVLYVQQFLPHFGYDIRVLRVGDRWLSVKRRAQAGQWRTNVSQGSRAEPHQLTDQQFDMACRAARATGGTLLGIDLLPTLAGTTFVLEVNAVPGWRGTAAALELNIADLVIEHLEQLHAQRS